MSRMEVEIPAALGGERVDKTVALLADLPRSVVARLIEEGRVVAGGRTVTKGSARLVADDVLSVELPEDEVVELQPEPDVVFAVVYDDDDVIVVDKPAGLVVHPGNGAATGTLAQGLLARYPDIADVGDPSRPGIVHRLDAGTSGLLVVARTAGAYDSLVAQLSRREATREYEALVHGDVNGRSGLVDAPLGRDPRNPVRRAVMQDGKEARTTYEVEERMPSLTRIGCRLETGRTHQIRVHLSAIGHPVAGDLLYGGHAVLGLTRPFLHARRLVFVHPGTDAEVAFSSSLPADLQASLAAAR